MIAASDNFAEYMIKDAQFHTYLGEASGNEVLSKLTAALFELLLEAMDEVYSKEPAVTKKTNQFHTNIFKAVESGLPDAARKAMLQHLDYVYSIITGNIQE
jgi:DNA-binding FadR family transcriptional regulator